MRTVIQKFGGTSLATLDARKMVIDKIIEAKNNYDAVVVVVSAMGRQAAPYATDTLLSLVGGKDTLLSPRELDLLMSCGETISANVLTHMLLEKGVKATALTGREAGIITEEQHLDADVIRVESEKLKKYLIDGNIVVVTGFQGCSESYAMTTLGRGGSDTSAVLIGEALVADVIEIYTDVNGIMTADPSICSVAKTLDHVSYLEVFQMADSGAKVIHPKAVDIARRAGIPIVIKNTFNDYAGSYVTWYNKISHHPSQEKLITSIAHRKNRVQFLVEGNMDDERFFEELAAAGVSIDIINIFPERRVFTIDGNKKKEALCVLDHYDADYSYIDHCCKITVVGERMTGVPGVMAKIIKSLTEAGVPLLQTADSLSTIACLIPEKDLEKAVLALHQMFNLEV